jgi:hypothetical protein
MTDSTKVSKITVQTTVSDNDLNDINIHVVLAGRSEERLSKNFYMVGLVQLDKERSTYTAEINNHTSGDGRPARPELRGRLLDRIRRGAQARRCRGAAGPLLGSRLTMPQFMSGEDREKAEPKVFTAEVTVTAGSLDSLARVLSMMEAFEHLPGVKIEPKARGLTETFYGFERDVWDKEKP